MNDAICYENHNEYISSLPMIFKKDVNDVHNEINWHENVELLHVSEGVAFVLCGNERVELSAGEFMIINSNVLHNVYSDKKIKYDYLIIDNSFAKQNGINLSKINFVSKIDGDIKLEMLFEEISDSLKADNLLIKTSVCCTLLKIILYICKNYSLNNERVNYDNDEIIKATIMYINNNISEKLTLDKISNAIGISKYHLIRKFSERVNLTPIEYINIRRCDNAKALLRENKYSIKQISLMCGFETPSYFSKSFYKLTGKRPSEYK